jgi:hypothetical protein
MELEPITERRRRRTFIWGLVVIGWYVALQAADGWVQSHYDVLDPAEGTHMGSTAVEFGYGLVYALMSMVPPVAGGLRQAFRQRIVVPLVGAGVVTAATSTIAFYVGGAAGCDVFGRGPGQDLWFYALVGSTLGSAALCALFAPRDARPDRVAVTFGLALGAATSFLIFLQGGQCAPFSQKVYRESFAMEWFVLAFPSIAGVVLGALLLRAAARNRPASSLPFASCSSAAAKTTRRVLWTTLPDARTSPGEVTL